MILNTIQWQFRMRVSNQRAFFSTSVQSTRYAFEERKKSNTCQKKCLSSKNNQEVTFDLVQSLIRGWIISLANTFSILGRSDRAGNSRWMKSLIPLYRKQTACLYTTPCNSVSHPPTPLIISGPTHCLLQTISYLEKGYKAENTK